MSQQPWLLDSAKQCPDEWAEMQRRLRAFQAVSKDASHADVIALYEDYLRATSRLREAWAAKQQQHEGAGL